jgi:uncharacterized protein YbbC (DUF1343 family)
MSTHEIAGAASAPGQGLSGGSVRPGLDVLLTERLDLVMGKRVGLITNPTGVRADLTSGIDALHTQAGVTLAALFGPEHGVRGQAQAGEAVQSGTDPRTGVPAYSLYGNVRQPTAEMLRGIDILLFDIQDVGARFYTYIWTMVLAMQAAAKHGVPFVVLDRPNPIAGLAVEGPVLDRRFESFVGMYPIPVRHGMTVGELARLFNTEYGIGAELTVVPAKGWRRELWFDQTGLPWIMPSPNMPTLETATVYPGSAFIEGTSLSEGRGTTRPCVHNGAPWIAPSLWAAEPNARGLPGVRFRPAYFAPTFSKHAGQTCGGVQLHVTDRQAFRPVATGVHLLDAARRRWPERFQWQQSGGSFSIDRLAGTDALRLALNRGVPPAEIIASWDEGARSFAQIRQKYLLY